MRRAALAGALVLAAGCLWMLELKAEPAADARLEPLRFRDIAGWDADDHAAAFRVFRRSCKAIIEADPVLRPAVAPEPNLHAACADALKLPDEVGPAEARLFFESHFEPLHIRPPSGHGFLTGYFEPEFDGALTRSAESSPCLLASRSTRRSRSWAA